MALIFIARYLKRLLAIAGARCLGVVGHPYVMAQPRLWVRPSRGGAPRELCLLLHLDFVLSQLPWLELHLIILLRGAQRGPRPPFAMMRASPGQSPCCRPWRVTTRRLLWRMGRIGGSSIWVAMTRVWRGTEWDDSPLHVYIIFCNFPFWVFLFFPFLTFMFYFMYFSLQASISFRTVRTYIHTSVHFFKSINCFEKYMIF